MFVKEAKMTIAEHTTKPILILGGTGKTGGRIAERLAALGHPVRIGSRANTPSFDWEDRATWRRRSMASAPPISATFQISLHRVPPRSWAHSPILRLAWA